MAEPKLQIERKVERLEHGLTTLAAYISPEITEQIDKILRGQKEGSDPVTIEDAIIKTEALIKGEKELAEADKAYIDPEHIEALEVLVEAAKGK